MIMHLKTQKNVTDMFNAADKYGNSYTIHELTNETVHTLLSGKTTTTQGPSEYRLSNGDPVNKISNDTFELVLSGKNLKRLK